MISWRTVECSRCDNSAFIDCTMHSHCEQCVVHSKHDKLKIIIELPDSDLKNEVNKLRQCGCI